MGEKGRRFLRVEVDADLYRWLQEFGIRKGLSCSVAAAGCIAMVQAMESDLKSFVEDLVDEMSDGGSG